MCGGGGWGQQRGVSGEESFCSAIQGKGGGRKGGGLQNSTHADQLRPADQHNRQRCTLPYLLFRVNRAGLHAASGVGRGGGLLRERVCEVGKERRGAGGAGGGGGEAWGGGGVKGCII